MDWEAGHSGFQRFELLGVYIHSSLDTLFENGKFGWIIIRNPMSTRIEAVHLVCLHDGHVRTLTATRLTELLGDQPTLANVASLWPRLVCENRHRRSARLYEGKNRNGRLLIDPQAQVFCGACGLPIILPRLETLPATSFCTACACDAMLTRNSPHWPQPPPGLTKCNRGHSTIIRQNGVTGDFFVGCSQFPKCWWSANLPSSNGSSG